MEFKVVITIDAERDLEKHIRYLIEEKRMTKLQRMY